MNTPSIPAASSNEGDTHWRRWALLVFAVGLVAISWQSLWIDEAFMAAKATQPTFADWWHAMPEGKGSDLQMPLYMIYVWSVARVFGFSEWVLRAANLPWFVAGATAFIRVFPARQKFTAAAVVLGAPFAWYYLNEARPYAMQLGASLLAFAALYRLSSTAMNPRDEERWFDAFCFGIVTLCGSSLLGVIWAGAALLSTPILFSWRRLLALARAYLATTLITVALLALLGAYYVWTLKSGGSESHATATSGNPALNLIHTAAHFRQGLAGGTDLRNLAFLGYEMLGLGGLGPARVDIRTIGFAAFHPFLVPLAVYSLVTGAVFILAVGQYYRSPEWRRRVGLAFVMSLPMVLLLGAGYFLSFRVLGRHFAPVMPVLLFLLTLGLTAWWSRRDWFSKTIAVLFVALSVASCLSFRFAARHAKDDYRGAAAVANAALVSGQRVWWSADSHGAVYYHVPLVTRAGETNGAILVQNALPDILSHFAMPDVILGSKPDLYDDDGAIADYLRNRNYLVQTNLHAFTIWRRIEAPKASKPIR